MACAQQDIIPLATIDAVTRPIGEASGLPNAAYTHPALFEFERDQVLGQTWAGLAYSSELPANGYVKPVDFMGLSLVIVRTGEGQLNVFHNVCSHRGMPLVQAEGAITGSIRCPYHSWTYDLSGRLKGTPHIGGVGVHSVAGFSCETHGLKLVRSYLWMGILFVNLSGNAEDFSSYIAPLEARWEPFIGPEGLASLRVAQCGSTLDIEVKANWKLPVENYCESYHLPWIHPELNRYSPLDQHYNILFDEGMSGQGTNVYTLSETASISLPRFSEWPEEKFRQAEYISLYPNVLLGLQADHVFAMILKPLSHDATLEKLQLYTIGEASIDASFENCREAVLASWRTVFGEDVSAVEGLQRGRKSPAFQGGVFTPVLDVPTHHFHCWVARHYSSATA